MTNYTADFCDEHPDSVSVLAPGLTNYGGAAMCEGEVVTIKLDRHNADLISLLRDENGSGKVVVVDAQQEYFAIVGEKLMYFAKANNYAGIILNGYIRDTYQIKDIPVALFALGTCPKRYTEQVTKGQRDVPLNFSGVDFQPGDYVYADTDGIIVAPKALS